MWDDIDWILTNGTPLSNDTIRRLLKEFFNFNLNDLRTILYKNFIIVKISNKM